MKCYIEFGICAILWLRLWVFGLKQCILWLRWWVFGLKQCILFRLAETHKLLHNCALHAVRESAGPPQVSDSQELLLSDTVDVELTSCCHAVLADRTQSPSLSLTTAIGSSSTQQTEHGLPIVTVMFTQSHVKETILSVLDIRNCHCTGRYREIKRYLYRPIGVQDVEATRISIQTATECCKVVSPKHRPPLPPREDPLYSFPLETESTPGP